MKGWKIIFVVALLIATHQAEARETRLPKKTVTRSASSEEQESLVKASGAEEALEPLQFKVEDDKPPKKDKRPTMTFH